MMLGFGISQNARIPMMDPSVVISSISYIAKEPLPPTRWMSTLGSFHFSQTSDSKTFFQPHVFKAIFHSDSESPSGCARVAQTGVQWDGYYRRWAWSRREVEPGQTEELQVHWSTFRQVSALTALPSNITLCACVCYALCKILQLSLHSKCYYFLSLYCF